MKREFIFITLLAAAGAISGYAVTAILMSISMPTHGQALLSVTEQQDFEKMATIAQSLQATMTATLIIAGLLGITALGFAAIFLNPQIVKKHQRKGLSIAKIVSAILILIAVDFLFSQLGIRPGPGTSYLAVFSTDELHFSLSALCLVNGLFYGLAWYVFGETGWLGDLSSWKQGGRDYSANPGECLLLGGVFGIAMTLVVYFFEISFEKYFLLISEVLDQSKETSSLGYTYFKTFLVGMTAVVSMIIAGFIVALAPSKKDISYRKRWLVFPMVLFAAVSLLAFVCYRQADAKYDLGKESLAAAAHLAEQSLESATVIVFNDKHAGNDFVVQEWPMQAEVYGFTTVNTIAATRENIKLLEDYINARPEGSVFNYAAEEGVFKIYQTLWDGAAILDQLKRLAPNTYLARMILLSQLSRMPVTPENLAILAEFADENKYSAGGNAAIKLAGAYSHFGKGDEARSWYDKGIAMGADDHIINEVQLPDETRLISGVINGKLRVNGVVPAGARVGLFVWKENDPEEIEPWIMGSRLAAITDLGGEGTFSFKNLGRHSYRLAVKTDRTSIPYDIAVEQISLKNAPGIISLDLANPAVDLGVIEVSVD